MCSLVTNFQSKNEKKRSADQKRHQWIIIEHERLVCNEHGLANAMIKNEHNDALERFTSTNKDYYPVQERVIPTNEFKWINLSRFEIHTTNVSKNMKNVTLFCNIFRNCYMLESLGTCCTTWYHPSITPVSTVADTRKYSKFHILQQIKRIPVPATVFMGVIL